MPKTHGYSGKPLSAKLGLKPGDVCLLVRAPTHYHELLKDASELRFANRKCNADVVHVFCYKRADLKSHFERALASIRPGGMIWVSWPKKSSKLFKDLTEQDLRDHVLPQGWVDVKVCAVDEDWSALKFLRRKSS